jgi:hypothetical protein
MIRPATLDDLPQLLVLGERMHAESRYRVLAFDRTMVVETLGSLIGSDMGFLWVAGADRITGGLAAMCMRHWCSPDLVAADLGMFFDPSERGGLDVVRLAKQYRLWARERGAKLIDLGVSTGVDADRTASLFDRIGFPRFGTIHTAES